MSRKLSAIIKTIELDDIVSVRALLSDDVLNQAQKPGGWTALHFAVSKGNLELVEFFLERGANSNVKNSEAMTPIFFACAEPITILKTLIRHGAVIDVQGLAGSTPLHCACEWRTIEAVNLLIDEGAKVEVTNREGKTPLYYACRTGQLNMVKLLVAHGAKPNRNFKDSHTVLNQACATEDLEGWQRFALMLSCA
jgi:ankyrin